MFWDKHKDLIITGVPWIIFSSLALILLCPKTSEMIQAWALITLVFVTIFYAKQTQKQAKFAKNLLDEQKLTRSLEFNERRLIDFYNPFHERLGEATNNFHKKSLKETRIFLDEAEYTIFWPYQYMLQKETREIIKDFFLDLITESLNRLEEQKKSELFKSLRNMSDKLHDEREIIENYISDNYSFPEKRNRKKVNHDKAKKRQKP